MKNYFDILGIDKNADQDTIKKAYRKLAMQYHPDRGGDQHKFQEIQEAYDMLTDSDKRAEWENKKYKTNKNPFDNFSFGGNDFDFDDFLDRSREHHFGFNRGQYRKPKKNKSLRVVVELDLNSTLQHQTKYISVTHLNGDKQYVSVNIPRGVKDQQQLKITGAGDASIKSLPPGDLHVIVKIDDTHGFSVEDINLTKKVQIDCFDAMTGVIIKIDGLENKQFEWKVPAGATSGSKFRIPKQGLWDLNNPVRGDLLLELVITVPKLTEAEIKEVNEFKQKLLNKGNK
jgi:curved DNA-binding protein